MPKPLGDRDLAVGFETVVDFPDDEFISKLAWVLYRSNYRILTAEEILVQLPQEVIDHLDMLGENSVEELVHALQQNVTRQLADQQFRLEQTQLEA